MESFQRPAALLDESQPAKAPAAVAQPHRSTQQQHQHQHQQQHQQQPHQRQHQQHQQQVHVVPKASEGGKDVQAHTEAALPQAHHQADDWRHLHQQYQHPPPHQQQHELHHHAAAGDAVQHAPAPPAVQYEGAKSEIAAPLRAGLAAAAVPPQAFSPPPAANLQQQHAAAAPPQPSSPPPAHLHQAAAPLPANLQDKAPSPPPTAHLNHQAAAPRPADKAPTGAELEQHVRDLVSSVVNRATEPSEKPLNSAPTVARKPTLPMPPSAVDSQDAAAAPAARTALPSAAVTAESSHLLSLLQRGFVDFCDTISHPERWDTALAKRTWRRIAPVVAAAARLAYQVVMFVAVWAAVLLTSLVRVARPAVGAQWRRRRATSARLQAVEARIAQWAAKLRAVAAPQKPKLDAVVVAAKRGTRAARRAADDFYVATVVPASHRHHLGTSLETARAASPTSAHAPGVVDVLVQRAQVAHDAACAGLVSAVAWTGRASRDAALRFERCSRRWDSFVASKLQNASPAVGPDASAQAAERKTW